MKLLFIPNWNGHLFLQEYEDKSITLLYKLIKSENKTLVKVEKNNTKITNQNIEKEFLNAYGKNSKILSITGDHSNSYPLIKTFAKKNPEFKLVIFDAHPDVEVSTDIITHEDYLRNLIENNIVKPQNIYLFGIRTFSRTEFEYLIEKKINFWTITDILKDKNKIKKILKELNTNIYLSIDIDVLDPDDAPGTYYREWCGLHINELEEFIEILKPKTNHIDITEFYSKKDENEITQKNILKLIKKFIN